jgi:TPR repeat protein
MMLRRAAALCLMLLLPVSARAAPLDDILARLQARDFATTIPKLRALAEAGDGPAQFAFGTVLEGAFGYPTPNVPEAIAWYRRAAEKGVPEAQNTMGDHLAQGRGVPQDYKAAAEFYRAAADKFPMAASHLGDLYCYGYGVPENGAECAKWYRKAAEAGVPRAQAALGGLYSSGVGVDKNDAEASNWFRIAANNGDVLGQIGLASAYRAGTGLKQDYVQGYVWLSVAKANPAGAAFGAELQKAIDEDLADTLAHLTPAQKAEAEKLLKDRVAKK